MADFREVLKISRNKVHGVPYALPFYTLSRTQEDLADGSIKLISYSEMATIGDCCQAIDEFAPCEKASKLGISIFLKTDKYYSSDEF